VKTASHLHATAIAATAAATAAHARW